MFEKEIKFISDFSLNKLKNLGSFVTFEKISTTDLHPAIVSYISAELDYMIFRDRKKLLEDSIFDYSGREISDHFNVIAAELKQNKKISISDVHKLITQAVSFNINYVVRPKWSLTKLIYNDQDFVSVDELERMLNYLYYYDYVKNVLSAYISKRKVIQLTLTEFDLILNKIDRELFKSNSEELINNALHSIADFFNIGGIDKNRTSLLAVEIFLKEKNLMDYLLKLRHAIPDGSRKKYEIEDIKKVLYSTAPIKPESISGYETIEPELNDFAAGKIKLQDIEVNDINDEAGSTKQSDFDETEIVTEEKIKPTSPTTEQVDDDQDFESILEDAMQNEEDLLPIEEEFNSDLLEPDSEVPASENQMNLTDVNDQPTENEQPDSSLEDDLRELIEEGLSFEEDNQDSEPVISNVEDKIEDDGTETKLEEAETEKDELLAFYEEELASMDESTEELSEKLDTPTEVIENEEQHVEEEEKQDVIPNDEDEMADIFEGMMEEPQGPESVETETIENEEQPHDKVENLTETEEESSEENLPVDGNKEYTENSDETSPAVEEETFGKDDFDFSIFEDEKADKIIDEIMDRLTEVSGEVLLHENDEKETLPEQESELNSDFELPEEEQTPQDEAVEKKIVDEMLEDYFGNDEKKEEDKSKDNGEEPFEPVENTISDESDVIEEESSTLTEEKITTDNGDNVFDTDLASSILEGSSFENDISNMIDEIDDIIEENTETFEVTDDIHKSETPKVDKPAGENEFNFESDTPVEEKIQDPVKKVEVPLRDKDLFSYLSRKEVKKIVSLVFLGDDEDFVTTIEKISECTTYKEATEILKGVFFTYRVSPYSKEAVALTNAVSNFFRQV
jgi:hypothetical protein